MIASSILPGFRFRLADLLRRPEDEALLDDPVYADFVLPGWQRDRARAEAERRRAEAAARRAEAMAARLRELGIEPDDIRD